MYLFKTAWVRSVFKDKKLKGEFHIPIQDLMGQICLQGEKIERRISCTYSGLDGSDIFLGREKIEKRISCTYSGLDGSDLISRREN